MAWDHPSGSRITPSTAASSPDGRVLATSVVNGDFALLDVATHQQVGALVPGAYPLAFSPDGKFVALAYTSGRGGVELLDAATQQKTGPVMTDGSSAQGAAGAFSPDGQVLAVSGANSVTFWSIAGHQIIGTPIAASANQVAFSPDGKTFATISGNGTRSSAETVNLWDAASHQELGQALTVNATARAHVQSRQHHARHRGRVDGELLGHRRLPPARRGHPRHPGPGGLQPRRAHRGRAHRARASGCGMSPPTARSASSSPSARAARRRPWPSAPTAS